MANVIYHSKLRIEKTSEAFSGTEQIFSSKDSETIARKFWDIGSIEIYESFNVVYLNKANKPIAWAEIGVGGTDGVVVDKKIVFAHAILANASAMIVFHNHPSGNLKPSEADNRLTRDLKQSGDIIGIKVLDHLILTANSYYSFADEGMI